MYMCITVCIYVYIIHLLTIDVNYEFTVGSLYFEHLDTQVFLFLTWYNEDNDDDSVMMLGV